MRPILPGLAAASLLGLVGCSTTTSYVHSDTTTLGRVVIYRNGVAYFERFARVDDDHLTLAVPADKVDDFLKSLSVVDAKSGQPAPVAYPTSPQPTGTGLMDMQIRLPGNGPHELRLSYVTEAPAWKPSYRVVVGDDKKVDLTGWAIVDNTSGEDWKNVRLGVGASSALSFRFDLRSVRTVERETLGDNALFAQAPPMGGATYGGPGLKKVVGDFTDDALAAQSVASNIAPSVAASVRATAAADGEVYAMEPRRGTAGGGHAGAPAQHIKRPTSAAAAPSTPPAGTSPANDQIPVLALQLRQAGRQVVVEGYAAPTDADKQVASQERANRLRDRLVQSGVDASQIVAVGKGAQPGHPGGARVVEAPTADRKDLAAAKEARPTPTEASAAGNPVALDPIGTSHFESSSAMTVGRGTSAMVAIFHAATEGEVVYLYDPDGARGNKQFAFRSLRFRNPTESQLETGPVSVFGEGRFVGEGLSEPIPAKQIAFVPFALDRQIVVDRTEGERDEIARILAVQRGVFSTQVQHIRKMTLLVHNRLPTGATLYVRHAAPPGYKPTKAPPDVERVAGADLYRVDVDGYGKREVTIEEATPVYRTADIRSPDGLEMVRVYLSQAVVNGPLKGEVEELLKTQKEIGEAEQHIATLRDQMGEYRQRMDELHAQIVTLRAVRTAGPLMTNLEKKLQEVSDKLSKATIDVVAVEEKLMLARIKFQDRVADLSLEAPAEKDVPPAVAGK
jgi:hypothetical protein